MDKPIYSTAQIIKQLTLYKLDDMTDSTGHSLKGTSVSWWPDDGEVTYSFAAPAGSSDGYQPGFMTDSMKSMARQAFGLWDDLINIKLTETTSAGADISMAYSSTTNADGSASVMTMDDVDYASSTIKADGHRDYKLGHAYLWLGTNGGASTDSAVKYGEFGFQGIYLHEIGHALGLEHPDPYDSGSTSGSITYENSAVYQQDSVKYTVMSYFGAWTEDADGRWTFKTDGDQDPDALFPQTPMISDIDAIQAKYGMDITTRNGNTQYGFNASADLASRPVFDFSKNTTPILTIWDGGGIDTIDASGFADAQTINLQPGTFSSIGNLVENVAIAHYTTIENATGGSGNDTIYGNAVDNSLLGRDGVDLIYGFDGVDLLYGQNGNDTLYGGNQNDYLYGGSGDDRLDGGAGADFMAGGNDNDTYWVDSKYDQVSEAASGGTLDTVNSSISFTIGANVYVERLNLLSTGSAIDGAGNDFDNTVTGTSSVNVLVGNGGNDALYGYADNDTLYGNAGNDILDGGTGNDKMTGGIGDDRYYVDAQVVYNGTVISGDIINEMAGEGSDTVNSTVTYTLGANLENLTLTGGAAISGIGNEVDNIIVGNSGNNVLNGGAALPGTRGSGGNDTLIGGAGKDTMTGGWGNDTFVFKSLSDSGLAYARDVITDFATGDRIDLSTIDANSLLAGNQAFSFVADFTGHAGEVQWDVVNTTEFCVTADVNGDKIADFMLELDHLSGLTSLTSADFLL
jgi:Ca2+-binding RTX toxin-like protein